MNAIIKCKSFNNQITRTLDNDTRVECQYIKLGHEKLLVTFKILHKINDHQNVTCLPLELAGVAVAIFVTLILIVIAQ